VRDCSADGSEQQVSSTVNDNVMTLILVFRACIVAVLCMFVLVQCLPWVFLINPVLTGFLYICYAWIWTCPVWVYDMNVVVHWHCSHCVFMFYVLIVNVTFLYIYVLHVLIVNVTFLYNLYYNMTMLYIFSWIMYSVQYV
jgi:hypothetical protein